MTTTAAITAVVLTVLVISTAAAPLVVNLAHADNGVPHEKNFGQCTQDKNRQACESNKDSFTGSG